MDKRLGMFDTNAFFGKNGKRTEFIKNKEELLGWNVFLYELTFLELDRIWKEMAWGNGKINREKPVIDKTNEYWKQISKIEKYLSREYDNLKYGGIRLKSKNDDLCKNCKNYDKNKKVQDRDKLDDVQCVVDVNNGRCPYLIEIMDEVL